MTFDRCFGCMQKLERPDEICPHCGFDINQDDEERFALRPGTILQGRYVVGKVLGKGGFGITYIGYDMSLDIRVAIKEYYPEGFVGRDARQSAKLNWYSTRTDVQNVIKSRDSLIKEARNMAKIDTLLTLVRVRDVLVANETAYLVMDYVEGETLKNLVMKTGTLSYEKVCTYLLPIMEDLSRIHEKGIIHRDISPDNIMIEANGQMRLLDLGAAKDLYRGNGTQGKANEQVPASTQMVLKHGFSPMEQYRTHGGIGPWTDVYAMTATIYYLMSGKILPTPMDRLDKEQEDAVQNIINKLSMPENAKEGMKKGLAILKDDRIKSMGELQKYFSSKKVEPKIEQKSELEVTPKSKNHKKLTVFLFGVVLVAVGIKLSYKSPEKYYVEENYEDSVDNKITGISLGGYTTQSKITFTAVGAGMDNENPGKGDVRYIPYNWKVVSTSSWNTAPYTASFSITKAGTYTLTVTFIQQMYNGSEWENTEKQDTKQVNFNIDHAQISTPTPTPVPLPDDHGDAASEDEDNPNPIPIVEGSGILSPSSDNNESVFGG